MIYSWSTGFRDGKVLGSTHLIDSFVCDFFVFVFRTMGGRRGPPKRTWPLFAHLFMSVMTPPRVQTRRERFSGIVSRVISRQWSTKLVERLSPCRSDGRDCKQRSRNLLDTIPRRNHRKGPAGRRTTMFLLPSKHTRNASLVLSHLFLSKIRIMIFYFFKYSKKKLLVHTETATELFVT